MTATQAKEVASSLATFTTQAKARKVNADGSVWRVDLPLRDYRGNYFRLYLFHQDEGGKESKKIILSDGGAMVRWIVSLGRPQLKSIQNLLATFGLMLMEDLTVMDNSNRAMAVRVISYLQAWCAVDGMFRIWDATKKEVANDLQSTKRHSGPDEAVRPGSELHSQRT